VQSYNPGRVFENLVIFGSATNEEYHSGPGDIRAFDVVTGRLIWTFHTVPHPGETGYETWPKRRMEDGRWRERLEQHGARQQARHPLRSDGQSQIQLLRRQSGGQELFG